MIDGEEVEVAEMAAIEVLLDFSLIKGDEKSQTFSMHPLQQLVSDLNFKYIILCGWLRVNESMNTDQASIPCSSLLMTKCISPPVSCGI